MSDLVRTNWPIMVVTLIQSVQVGQYYASGNKWQALMVLAWAVSNVGLIMTTVK